MEGDRAERERARKLVDKEEASLDEVRTELKRTRELLDKRRSIAKEVRDDLKRAELEQEVERLRVLAGEAPEEPPPNHMGDDDKEVVKLGSKLDDLSGLIEEGIATRDRLLEKLDRLREREAEAENALNEALEEREEDREALKRMRERRKRMQERQDRPSEHFAYAEFDCNNGQKVPKESEPAIKDWCERIGEPLRKKFGPVHINSGYRPTAYNASVGGEPNSVHIYDYPGRNFRAVAVDVTCANGSPSEWYAFTAGKADGRGSYATFHHADNRSRIGWPAATWTG
jgi:hypothetical protein